MWADAQAQAPIGLSAETPDRVTAEGRLEGLPSPHRHGIGHLLVKRRVAQGRRAPVVEQRRASLEIHPRQKLFSTDIEIEHLD